MSGLPSVSQNGANGFQRSPGPLEVRLQLQGLGEFQGGRLGRIEVNVTDAQAVMGEVKISGVVLRVEGPPKKTIYAEYVLNK
jgi:hypothetical protein